MTNDQFEALMREGERFHSVRLPDGEYAVIRVDGHRFSRFTEQHFQKPFDTGFHDIMVQTARVLLESFNGLYAYTESDEISVLLPKAWNTFHRSHEKTVSISAGLASAVFSHASGHLVRFDSRVWLGTNKNQVTDYFRWRQSDAARCALNGWCYWTMRQQGQSYIAATTALECQTAESKLQLLAEYGVDFASVPQWQRHGTGLFWEEYEKPGRNPVTGQAVTALRRRIATRDELPVSEAYATYLRNLMPTQIEGM